MEHLPSLLQGGPRDARAARAARARAAGRERQGIGGRGEGEGRPGPLAAAKAAGRGADQLGELLLHERRHADALRAAAPPGVLRARQRYIN